MKANEFKLEKMLAEIAMNPRSLQAAVEKIPARAGMEFEMYVPSAAEEVEDFQSVPDYDEDRRVQGLDDIVEFFDQSSENSSGVISRLKRELVDDYNKWLGDGFVDDWQRHASGYIYTYLKTYAIDSDIAEILDIEDEDRKITGVEYQDAADALVDELGKGNYWYDSAREDASDNYNYEHSEDVWAKKEFTFMSDVENHYSWLSWPLWTEEPEATITVSIDDIANEFASDMGRPVKASNTYHAARREPGHYVVEPDGSLDKPKDSSDRGLEFVSPPLSIPDIFSDLKKVQKWASRMGCYTNESTGLHINISIEGANVDQLDYIKLALLLGDQYVLEKFDRTGSIYCRSAISKIQDKISQLSDNQVQAFMLEMRKGLNQLASRAILEPGQIGKYTSIHPKDGYIEFRSAGGDWLDLNFDKIENTALRMVVALDAAYDPEKYRKEYLKKLSKILNPNDQSDAYGDMINEFNNYVVATGGALTTKLTKEQQQALKAFRSAALQQIQKSNRTRLTSAKNVYEIVYRGTTPPTPVFKFIATTVGEAWRKYADWLAGGGYSEDTNVYGFRNISSQQVQGGTRASTPIASVPTASTPTASTPTATTVSGSTYSTPSVYRWAVLINGVQVFELNAATQGEANQLARTWLLQRSREFLRAHQGGEIDVVPQFT